MNNRYAYSLAETLLFPVRRNNHGRLRQYLNDKTILITGASYGIGASLALLLAGPGTRLILVARTKEKLEAVQKAAEGQGAQAWIFSADLCSEEAVSGLLCFLQAFPHSIDFMISNAGKSLRRPLMDSLDRYSDFNRTMALHYHAPVRLLLALLPGLAAVKGHIVHVSALNVLLPPAPLWAAYQASKAAMDQWMGSAAPELKQYGVNVSSIYLPLVRTRMIREGSRYSRLPALHPDHAAAIIARCILYRRPQYRPWWFPPLRILAAVFRPAWFWITEHYLQYQRKHEQASL